MTLLIAFWLLTVPLSFYVRTRNTTIIRMGSVWCMLIFGPVYLVFALHDLDTIVWEKDKTPKEKKKEKEPS